MATTSHDLELAPTTTPSTAQNTAEKKLTLGQVALQKDYPHGVTIGVNNVSVTDRVAPGDDGTNLPNVFSPFLSLGKAVSTGCKKADFHRIKDISATFLPGHLYLILAGPSAGKSALLRSIAHKIQTTPQSSGPYCPPVDGTQANTNNYNIANNTVFYNNFTAAELEKVKIDVRKLVMYIDQTDFSHLPELTVEETFAFTAKLSLWDATKSTEENNVFIKQRIDHTIAILGLEECRHTIIGGANLRGISGGQKRRVSVGNALCTNSKILCLDQFTDGIDSKYAEEITYALRDWARTTGGIVITALQQPGKEIVDAFDSILLLREGLAVFNGPVVDLEPFLQAMGYIKPEDVELADFAINVLLAPQQVLTQQKHYLHKVKHQQEAQRIKKEKYKTLRGALNTSNNNSNSIDNNNSTSMPGGTLVNSNNNSITINNNTNPPKTNPRGYAQQQQKTVQTTQGVLNIAPQPCVTTVEMLEYYQQTPFFSQTQQQLATILAKHAQLQQDNYKLTSSNNDNNDNDCFDIKKYPLSAAAPTNVMFSAILNREFTLLTRSTGPIISRLANGIFLSFIYGGLYFNVPHDDFFMRLSAFMITITQLAFSSLISLASIVEQNINIKRDAGNNLYPTWAFVLSSLLRSLPLTMAEVTIFGVILYFMIGNIPLVSRFFIYYAIIAIQSIQLDILFKVLASLCGTVEEASTFSQTFVSLASLLSGFFITKSSLPDFMIEFYWVSPFSWSVRALVLNELKSTRYDELITYIDPKTTQPITQRVGDLYLQNADVTTDEWWILWGGLYLLGLVIVFLITHAYVLHSKSRWFEESRGTRRIAEEVATQGELEAALHEIDNNQMNQYMNDNNGGDNDVHMQQQLMNDVHTTAVQQQQQSRLGNGDMSTTTTKSNNNNNNNNTYGIKLDTITQYFPSSPVWLSFHDLSYTIKVKSQDGKELVDRKLLNDVFGFAQPGKLTALVGSSGAGKTTLLDVLAFRKNTGVIDGKVLFNGQTPTPTMISSLIGYVQQFDSLFPYTTVYDTLLFAAELRLSTDIPYDAKKKIVEELMELLNLTNIRNCMVGNTTTPGLSQAQLKRLNIGVELVSNPSVIFLDEPTSSLDSAAATAVMLVVRRIATVLNKSIICTIHQPSAELFYLFDRLCLLAPGGHQIFWGNLGLRSADFIEYFQTCPGVYPLVRGKNPASWLLEQSGAGTDLEANKRFVLQLKQFYQQSAICQQAQKQLQLLSSIVIINDTTTNTITTENTIDLRLTNNNNNTNQQQQSRPQNNNNNNNPDKEYSISLTTQYIPKTTTQVLLHKRPNLFKKFIILFSRQFQQYYRGSFTVARLITAIFLSLLFGLLYFGTEYTTQATMMARISSFGVVLYFSATVASASLPVFELRPIFYRESSTGFYPKFLWATVQFLNEVIWTLPYSLFAAVPLYFMNNPPDGADKFFLYWVAAYLLILTYTASTLWLTACSASIAASTSFMSAFLGLSFIFSSLTITVPQTAQGWHWLYYLTPLSKCCNLIMQLFEDDYTPVLVVKDNVPFFTTARQFTTDYLGFAYGMGNYAANIGYLFAYIFVVQVFAHLATIFFNFEKR